MRAPIAHPRARAQTRRAVRLASAARAEKSDSKFDTEEVLQTLSDKVSARAARSGDATRLRAA